MAGSNAEGGGNGWGMARVKEQILLSSLRQGPAFLVLICLLYGLWHFGDYLVTEGITRGIDQITRGYREIQEAHDRNLREVIEAFEREQARDTTMVGLVREAIENRELLKETHQLLVEMRARRELNEGWPKQEESP